MGLRTQQIIDLESGAGRVADPLGGSWYVEALTDELEQRILARVRELEAVGDGEALADRGVFRGIFLEAMEEGQRRVDTGELTIVGLNALRIADEDDTLLKDVSTGKIEPWRCQSEKIARLRRQRDVALARAALDGIRRDVRSGANLVPSVITALEACATIGEITTSMRRALDLPADPFDHPLP